MKKDFLPLLIIFLILSQSGCLTRPPVTAVEISDEDMGHHEDSTPSLKDLSYDTSPLEGEFRIAALAPRFQLPEDETRYALANAGRQMSIYNGARVRFAKIMDQNVIGTVQDQKVDVLYDRDMALSYIEDMTVIGETRDPDAYAALVSLKGDTPENLPQTELIPGVRPSWINSPPESGQYIFGVGVSGRRRSVFESFYQADNLAMAEIAAFIETSIYSGIANIERTGESYNESTTSSQTVNLSDVYIEGMIVISRWREADNSFFYSLAVAPKPD
ncbi:LPP20 family lipoprotein [Spirochaeta isovalerica]|uniref:Lipoprotein n=1 Tax=Spirochaeta isovalerica TaxID=150 RepID=A0A841RAZ0_9SPIO|nr:LPP20 family lipoprotein [Spirochaeta isovalerica]MBB6481093.1 hypothetical protein [Spirochaeta isovalerica]